MKVYCVKERRFTPNKPGTDKVVTTKNGRKMLKVTCASCGKTKTKFIPTGAGGALARRKPRIVDKIAEGASMFLSGPAPSFGSLGRLLGSQAYKGVKDNINYYRKGRR